MKYKNQKLILTASEAAFDRGDINSSEYLNIIKDVENDLHKYDKHLLSEEIETIIKNFVSGR